MSKTDRGRNVKPTIEKCLWGMTVGRCEFQGCNTYLGEHSVTKSEGNFGEKAHVEAVSEGGARYKELMPNEELNSSDNIMILCPTCHKLIDEHPEEYTVDVLKEMKRTHEIRIYQLTEIDDIQKTLVVNYFANIEGFSPMYEDRLFCRAVIKNGKVPSNSYSVPIGTENMPFKDGNNSFYLIQEELLNSAREKIIKPSIKNEESISLFALAPIPLLIKLGTLFRDISNVTVYQCHRTGEKWAWKKNSNIIEYQIEKNRNIRSKEVALNISLSAEILQDRIDKELGEVCTYKITIANPNRLFVENEGVVDEFVKIFRKCMEQIKNENPEIQTINIFPAMPNLLAVRLGMDYMPKTDPKLIIYDQISSEAGFIKTIEIGD